MSVRRKILAVLQDNRGRWISGEALSSAMHISRSAIWKHVGVLRSEGYGIESSSNKGYLLQSSPDVLTVEEIRNSLDTRYVDIRDVVCLKETDSTNRRAKLLAEQGAPEGTLIVADTQSGGRGRRGRTWFSPAHTGIYTSLILRPSIPPGEAPRCALLTSVAVAESLLNGSGVRGTIKWPNDILVKGKKIAGILVEIGTELDMVEYMIVGVGLNVNTPPDDFPPEIRDRATSILAETGMAVRRVDVLCEFLKQFEKYYEMFTDGRFNDILDQWKAFEDVIGRTIRVDSAGTAYSGTAAEIDPDGALLVRDSHGRLHRVFSGDITVMHEQ
jgi:BirA family biotin operon repressor/biotin-[acetyl-CoA-carboxylase] ligase